METAIIVGIILVLIVVIRLVAKASARVDESNHARAISNPNMPVESEEKGEDTQSGSVAHPGACPLPNLRLSIELVPKTAWFDNVRSAVSPEEWDEIRKPCYAKAGHRCEICGDVGFSQGKNYPVECHEIWHYDDATHKQTLTGFIALCPHCHKVKHAGLAFSKGEAEIVIRQLMKVNNITREEDAYRYVHWAIRLWEYRSQFDWKCDISLIGYETW